jgi:antitoxin component YwqK of YwqJK toxin-antitoxin module
MGIGFSLDTIFLGIIALSVLVNNLTIRNQGKKIIATLKTIQYIVMNEEEIISGDSLKEEKNITLYRGEPFTGVSKDWFKSGNIKKVKHYKNGILDGLEIEWDEYGNRIYQATMKDGLIASFHK